MVCVLHPVFCLYGATALAKKKQPIVYQDAVYCKFLLYVSVEIEQ